MSHRRAVQFFSRRSIALMMQRGSVAVEAALILPIMIMMIFGGIQLTAMYYDYQVIYNAANEAARQGVLSSSSPLDAKGVASVASTYIAGNPLITFGNTALPSYKIYLCKTDSTSTFTIQNASTCLTTPLSQTAPVAAACPATRAIWPAGNLLVVTVGYDFKGPYTPTWANKYLTATVQFMCE